MKQFCVHGHDTFVVGRKSDGYCRQCHRDGDARWNKTLRGKVVKSTTARRRYQTDPARRAKILAQSAAWRRAHPERDREHARKHKAKYKGVNFWVEAAKESV